MTRTGIWIRCLVLCLVGLLAACAKGSGEPKPPEILYGQDLCSQCGMVIDDPRFAAATILKDGSSLKFDDAGEMLIYHMNHPEKQVQVWWAHDFRTEEWIRGETAFYVKADTLKTPMGTGIVAFADRAQAEEAAQESKGKIYTFDEIRAQVHMDVHGALKKTILNQ